jgi:hypothetical protein
MVAIKVVTVNRWRTDDENSGGFDSAIFCKSLTLTKHWYNCGE